MKEEMSPLKAPRDAAVRTGRAGCGDGRDVNGLEKYLQDQFDRTKIENGGKKV